MSIDSSLRDSLRRQFSDLVLTVHAPGFPAAIHPTEPDLFSRQQAMPGHNQAKLERACIAIVGCGGLGSWAALALARMGVRRLVLMDSDRFDRSNAHRQLMAPEDLGVPKAHAVARHVLPHMLNRGVITGIALGCEDAIEHLPERVDGLFVGVDNNAARLAAAAFALPRRIPAVFAMLSEDGLRAQAFLQEPAGPCLRCVLPNSDPGLGAPCAAASMASCQLVDAHALFMLMSALMQRPRPLTWREVSLDGSTERIGRPERRGDCDLCPPSTQ